MSALLLVLSALRLVLLVVVVRFPLPLGSHALWWTARGGRAPSGGRHHRSATQRPGAEP